MTPDESVPSHAHRTGGDDAARHDPLRRQPLAKNAAPSKAANTTLVSRSADTAPIGLDCIAQMIAP